MQQKLEQFLSPAFRTWLYGVATAVLVVLSAYGFLDDGKMTAWTGLIAAITGLAAMMVSPVSGDPDIRKDIEYK